MRLAPSVPLAFGWLKPVILLPLDTPFWPRERLDAVLGHERAHVRRHDNLSQMVALLACAFYWFNPFLWLARDAMCRDAEIAADDFVLASGMRPSAYAAELVELAAEYCGHTPSVALAMASRSSLEVRVTSILSPTSSRKGVTAMDALRFACLGSAAALMLAFARPGIAEAQAPAPVQVAPFAPAMPDMPEPPEPPAPAPAPLAMPVMAVPPAPAPDPVHASPMRSDRLTDEEKAKFKMAMAQLKLEMKKARPELRRLAADARAQAEIQAVTAVEALPAIQAAVKQAMAQVQPVIWQAVGDGRIEEKVAAAMARAQVSIDKALIRSARNEARESSSDAWSSSSSDSAPSASMDENVRQRERAKADLERAKAKVERALADVKRAEARVARVELEAARDAAHAESEAQRRARDAERERDTRSPE